MNEQELHANRKIDLNPSFVPRVARQQGTPHERQQWQQHQQQQQQQQDPKSPCEVGQLYACFLNSPKTWHGWASIPVDADGALSASFRDESKDPSGIFCCLCGLSFENKSSTAWERHCSVDDHVKAFALLMKVQRLMDQDAERFSLVLDKIIQQTQDAGSSRNSSSLATPKQMMSFYNQVFAYLEQQKVQPMSNCDYEGASTAILRAAKRFQIIPTTNSGDEDEQYSAKSEIQPGLCVQVEVSTSANRFTSEIAEHCKPLYEPILNDDESAIEIRLAVTPREEEHDQCCDSNTSVFQREEVIVIDPFLFSKEKENSDLFSSGINGSSSSSGILLTESSGELDGTETNICNASGSVLTPAIFRCPSVIVVSEECVEIEQTSAPLDSRQGKTKKNQRSKIHHGKTPKTSSSSTLQRPFVWMLETTESMKAGSQTSRAVDFFDRIAETAVEWGIVRLTVCGGGSGDTIDDGDFAVQQVGDRQEYDDDASSVWDTGRGVEEATDTIFKMEQKESSAMKIPVRNQFFCGKDDDDVTISSSPAEVIASEIDAITDGEKLPQKAYNAQALHEYTGCESDSFSSDKMAREPKSAKRDKPRPPARNNDTTQVCGTKLDGPAANDRDSPEHCTVEERTNPAADEEADETFSPDQFDHLFCDPATPYVVILDPAKMENCLSTDTITDDEKQPPTADNCIDNEVHHEGTGFNNDKASDRDIPEHHTVEDRVNPATDEEADETFSPNQFDHLFCDSTMPSAVILDPANRENCLSTDTITDDEKQPQTADNGVDNEVHHEDAGFNNDTAQVCGTTHDEPEANARDSHEHHAVEDRINPETDEEADETVSPDQFDHLLCDPTMSFVAMLDPAAKRENWLSTDTTTDDEKQPQTAGSGIDNDSQVHYQESSSGSDSLSLDKMAQEPNSAQGYRPRPPARGNDIAQVCGTTHDEPEANVRDNPEQHTVEDRINPVAIEEDGETGSPDQFDHLLYDPASVVILDPAKRDDCLSTDTLTDDEKQRQKAGNDIDNDALVHHEDSGFESDSSTSDNMTLKPKSAQRDRPRPPVRNNDTAQVCGTKRDEPEADDRDNPGRCMVEDRINREANEEDGNTVSSDQFVHLLYDPRVPSVVILDPAKRDNCLSTDTITDDKKQPQQVDNGIDSKVHHEDTGFESNSSTSDNMTLEPKSAQRDRPRPPVRNNDTAQVCGTKHDEPKAYGLHGPEYEVVEKRVNPAADEEAVETVSPDQFDHISCGPAMLFVAILDPAKRENCLSPFEQIEDMGVQKVADQDYLSEQLIQSFDQKSPIINCSKTHIGGAQEILHKETLSADAIDDNQPEEDFDYCDNGKEEEFKDKFPLPVKLPVARLTTIQEDWGHLDDETERAASCIAALAFEDVY